jgi:hypothetical protein
MAVQTLTTGDGFLTSFNATTPRLYITAETDTIDEFDQIMLKHWREEGFDVIYLPFGRGGKAYVKELEGIKDSLSLGDSFGVVGRLYSNANSNLIKICLMSCIYSFRRCCRSMPRDVSQIHRQTRCSCRLLSILDTRSTPFLSNWYESPSASCWT